MDIKEEKLEELRKFLYAQCDKTVQYYNNLIHGVTLLDIMIFKKDDLKELLKLIKKMMED